MERTCCDAVNSIFYSIEINPQNCTVAAENLRAAGLLGYVRTINGVSIPSRMLKKGLPVGKWA